MALCYTYRPIIRRNPARKKSTGKILGQQSNVVNPIESRSTNPGCQQNTKLKTSSNNATNGIKSIQIGQNQGDKLNRTRYHKEVG